MECERKDLLIDQSHATLSIAAEADVALADSLGESNGLQHSSLLAESGLSFNYPHPAGRSSHRSHTAFPQPAAHSLSQSQSQSRPPRGHRNGAASGARRAGDQVISESSRQALRNKLLQRSQSIDSLSGRSSASPSNFPVVVQHQQSTAAASASASACARGNISSSKYGGSGSVRGADVCARADTRAQLQRTINARNRSGAAANQFECREQPKELTSGKRYSNQCSNEDSASTDTAHSAALMSAIIPSVDASGAAAGAMATPQSQTQTARPGAQSSAMPLLMPMPMPMPLSAVSVVIGGNGSLNLIRPFVQVPTIIFANRLPILTAQPHESALSPLALSPPAAAPVSLPVSYSAPQLPNGTTLNGLIKTSVNANTNVNATAPFAALQRQQCSYVTTEAALPNGGSTHKPLPISSSASSSSTSGKGLSLLAAAAEFAELMDTPKKEPACSQVAFAASAASSHQAVSQSRSSFSSTAAKAAPGAGGLQQQAQTHARPTAAACTSAAAGGLSQATTGSGRAPPLEREKPPKLERSQSEEPSQKLIKMEATPMTPTTAQSPAWRVIPVGTWPTAAGNTSIAIPLQSVLQLVAPSQPQPQPQPPAQSHQALSSAVAAAQSNVLGGASTAAGAPSQAAGAAGLVATPRQDLVCQQCAKRFNTAQEFYLHEKAHSIQPQHKCSVCGMAYTKAAHLQRHQKSQNHMPSAPAAAQTASHPVKLNPEENKSSRVLLNNHHVELVGQAFASAAAEAAPSEGSEPKAAAGRSDSVCSSLSDAEPVEPSQSRASSRARERPEIAGLSAVLEAGHPRPRDPRPFRCEVCEKGFRVQGHLTKHLRSKAHVDRERLQPRPAAGGGAHMPLAAQFVPATANMAQLVVSTTAANGNAHATDSNSSGSDSSCYAAAVGAPTSNGFVLLTGSSRTSLVANGSTADETEEEIVVDDV